MEAQTLYIKNSKAHRLAKQVSKQMGVTLTEAVIRSLESQVRTARQPIDLERIAEICSKVRALPDRDTRSIDEILGYNEIGVPS